MGLSSAITGGDGRVRPAVPGLRHGTVSLVDHDPCWDRLFDELAERIRRCLGDLALGIEHVGSTAVAGLAAKPIVDIAVGIDLQLASPVVAAMEGSGWLFRGDKGDDGGLLFVLESRTQVRIAHAHAVEHDGSAWTGYVAFRDLLRSDPDARQQYLDVKQQLAAEFPGDRAAYTTGKEALVRQLLGASRA